MKKVIPEKVEKRYGVILSYLNDCEYDIKKFEKQFTMISLSELDEAMSYINEGIECQ